MEEEKVCEVCDGVGHFTVDTITNGEFDQYEQVCECRMNDEPADMSGADGEGDR